nr:uncharacterized protein LOC127292936 [Lolium perenne]
MLNLDAAASGSASFLQGVSGGEHRVNSAPTVSSAVSSLAGRISVNLDTATGVWLQEGRGDAGISILVRQHDGPWMRWHRRRGPRAQGFASASGIGIMSRGGRRCRWHLHRGRAASGLNLGLGRFTAAGHGGRYHVLLADSHWFCVATVD